MAIIDTEIARLELDAAIIACRQASDVSWKADSEAFRLKDELRRAQDALRLAELRYRYAVVGDDWFGLEDKLLVTAKS